MNYTQIKGTPFTLVEDEDNKVCFAAVSNYRVTEIKELNDENKEYIKLTLKQPNWDIIIPVIEVLIKRILTSKFGKNGRNTQNH